jgi:molybdate transport system substrate-binding protein
MRELKVVCSGGFKAALLALVPAFEAASGLEVATQWGSSVAGTPSAIPARLARGEPVDVAILSSAGLALLLEQGSILPGHTSPLARSGIGLAVRAGAPRPDVASLAALKATLIASQSIAISRSASGIYLQNLFATLGLMPVLSGKLILSGTEPVGEIVARGAAEIGLQQVSELLPVAGIDYVGPLPAAVQEMTTFAAGVTANATAVAAALNLIRFLSGPAARASIERAGMTPIEGAHLG